MFPTITTTMKRLNHSKPCSSTTRALLLFQNFVQYEKKDTVITI